jgi:adenosylcobinamide-phosphate synthase
MTRAPRVRRLAPAAAVAADAAFGEPPAWLHPTVAMGRLLAGARRRQAVAAGGAAHAFAWGVSTVAAGALAAWAAGRLVERAAGRARDPLGVALTGLALKPALSVRALLSAAGEVERALRASDLAGARRLLAWHLVSRDTVDLSPAEVAGAAVESVAENFNDAVVAPILAFRVGGLGLAYAHRFVNTADAMLGYRTPELEWFGKTAARADDVLGLAPARLSALLIAAAALHVAARDAGRTASPNAGWPMAAMAGALGVRLTKRAAYTLNPRGREPGWRDLARSRRVVAAAAALAVGAAAA